MVGAALLDQAKAATPSQVVLRVWTANPTVWDNGYFDLLFGYEWELTKSPAGAFIWHAIDQREEDMAPTQKMRAKLVPTMMTTADMALRMDPAYEKISRRFHEKS